MLQLTTPFRGCNIELPSPLFVPSGSYEPTKQSQKMATGTLSSDTTNVTALVIEQVLEAFGLIARVVVVQNMGKEVLYGVEIAVGTRLDNLIHLDKDLAMATSSPTGTVRIQAPIPGTTLVGIWIPKKGTVEQEALAKRLTLLKKAE